MRYHEKDTVSSVITVRKIDCESFHKTSDQSFRIESGRVILYRQDDLDLGVYHIKRKIIRCKIHASPLRLFWWIKQTNKQTDTNKKHKQKQDNRTQADTNKQ